MNPMLLPTEIPTADCSLCGKGWPVGQMVSPGDGTHYCPLSTPTNPKEAADCARRAAERQQVERGADEAKRSLLCPTCESPQPSMHPAISGGGEVTKVCPDPWHNDALTATARAADAAALAGEAPEPEADAQPAGDGDGQDAEQPGEDGGSE